ncbi:MAG: PAS domain-containing protein [Deltaproteobacteria bacterium]|nr:PAS domain-containing protein [Deltaproteobacteria bacterium]
MENFKKSLSATAARHEISSAAALSLKVSLWIQSPARLVMLVALSVFISEATVMFVIAFLPVTSLWLHALFDATLLVILLAPVLYFCLFRTLVGHIQQRQMVEAELRDHRDRLDELVAERTAELTAANQALKNEISERKKAEAELTDRAERARQIADSLPLLVASVGADRRYRFLNREHERLYGISPPEFVGRKVEDLIGSEHYEVVRGHIKTVMSGKPVVFEEKISLPDGSFRHYFAQYIPDVHQSRQIDGFFLVAQDISARKQAENELKHELAINSALSDLYEPLISPDASIEDIAHTVLDKAKALTGSEHGYVSSIHPDTGDNVSHTLTEMMKDQCNVTPENMITFPRGENGQYKSLWGHALNTLEAFYTNSPQGHFSSAGLPSGHIALDRFLSVPVMLGKELVGQIALANKSEDYTDKDLEAIGRIAEFYALAIQKNRAGKALQLAKNGLEKRVDDRTAELFEANRKLKAEIKDRIRSQAQLQQSKSRLQAVFDSISEPLILLNEEMVVKMLNKTAAGYYGLSEYRDLLDSKCHQMLRSSDEPCEGCEIPTAVVSGKSMAFERKGFMDPDRLEQVVIYPVQEKGGDSQDYLLRISDITNQRMFEKQLIHSEKMSSLGVLVSSIAHEINNPNSFISFNIPILREYIEEVMPIVDDYAAGHPGLEICHMAYPAFRKDITRLLDNIDHGSGRITRFVSNLKEFSQVKGKVKEDWIELNSVVENVLAICNVQLKKTVKSVVTHIPENLPRIWSDPTYLEQVLLNLLVNAAQAADKDDSRIEINVDVQPSWLDHTILEVKDNGSGMDEKTRQEIFDPFFTTKAGSGGTGLGLYVCHNLIHSLKGRIEVESELGRGSTFRIILPDKERRSRKRS